jgi:serine/threonine protein kinase
LNHCNIIKPAGFTLIPSSIISDEFSTGDSDSLDEAGDVMFLACYEYASNKDLASYLKENPGKRHDDAFVISVLDSILSGLEYVHDRQVLHGDIKPENVRPISNCP